MNSLSISVMAHPSREEYFPYLQERLGGVPMTIDTGFGIWENCKRAWRLRNTGAAWHVVIQDDAIVCDDFHSRALAALEEAEKHGCDAVSFFFGKRIAMQGVAKKALEAGYSQSKWIHWGLAICLRAELIEPMIAFGDKMNIPQDDARIANFIKSKGLKCYYPMPSLVDHRIGPSLVGDKGTGRCAYSFIDNV